MATHITNAKYQRWDDDAFGFILMDMPGKEGE